MVQDMLFSPGDIEAREGKLQINLTPLSAPHRSRAMESLCAQLNEIGTKFPGTDLVMHFGVKPAPPPSMAFPGARPAKIETGQIA